MSASPDGFNNIAKAVESLQGLLIEKEKELDLRESDFQRRVALYEKENPNIGRDSDVLSLNVGGRTGIVTLRSTLTQFEDSMLAAKFSGRWDDSIEKDKDGNFFIDVDPDQFLTLLKYLRLRAAKLRKDITLKPPPPHFDFCCMLEQFDLMSGIYPHKWISFFGACVNEQTAYGSLRLTSQEQTAVHTSNDEPYNKLSVVAFTVRIERGSMVQVGWVTSRNRSFSHSDTRTSLYMDATARKINWKTNKSATTTTEIDNIEVNVNQNDVVVNFSHLLNSRSYQVEVEQHNAESVVFSYDFVGELLTPMIIFTGSVVVSNVQYRY